MSCSMGTNLTCRWSRRQDFWRSRVPGCRTRNNAAPVVPAVFNGCLPRRPCYDSPKPIMKTFRSVVNGIGCALLLQAVLNSSVAAPIPDECKVGDFFVGTQAYTFNRFTVLEAIEKTAQA